MDKNNLNNQSNTSAPANKFQTSYTYYIFLVCNFISMLGLAISLIFTNKNNPNLDYQLPIIICNVVSLLILVVFLYFESRIILPYKFHINHKWYGWFISSVIIFSLILVVSTIIVCLPVEWTITWSITLFVSCMVMSLFTIGIYKYGRFHIDKEIYLRKNGIEINKEKNQQNNKMSDKEFKKMQDKLDNCSPTDYNGKKATSNLVDKLDEYEEPKNEI